MRYELDDCWIEWEDPTYINSSIEYSYPFRKREMEDCLKDALRECVVLDMQNQELLARCKKYEKQIADYRR